VPNADPGSTVVGGVNTDVFYSQTGISVAAGDKVDFIFDPKAFQFSDSTEFDATITFHETVSPDHFKCYEVEDSTRIYKRVSLEDQFDESGPEENVKVRGAKIFCNPVDKNGEGISDAENHLTCYKIESDQPKRTIEIENQFGPQTLVIDNAKVLCVPSSKLNVSLGDQLNEDDDDDDDD
jgi:hypothetical protein